MPKAGSISGLCDELIAPARRPIHQPALRRDANKQTAY
jgi:hypothetical protein